MVVCGEVVSRGGQSGSRGPAAVRRRGSERRDSDIEGGSGDEEQRTAAETATMDHVGSGGGTVTWDGGSLFVGRIELSIYPTLGGRQVFPVFFLFLISYILHAI